MSSFTYSVYYLSEKRSLLHIFIINPFSSCKVPFFCFFYMACPKLKSNIKIHSVRCDWWFLGWSSQPQPSSSSSSSSSAPCGIKQVTIINSADTKTRLNISYQNVRRKQKKNDCQKANSWDLYTLWRPRLLKHISTLLKQHIRTHWVVNAIKINTNVNTVKCKSTFICLKCTVYCDVICLHTN